MFTRLRMGLSALLILGIFSAIHATPAMAIPIARLAISSTEITVGSAFTIDVFVDGTNGTIFDPTPYAFDAFDFNVNNVSGLTLSSVLFASPFVTNGGTTDILNLSGLPTGLLIFSDIIWLSPAVSPMSGPSILLATLNFTADTIGTYSLGINSGGDANGLSLAVASLTSTCCLLDGNINGINVNPAATTAVPEPSTLLLLGTGLIGVAGFKKARLKITRRVAA